MIRLILAENHKVVRQGLKALLQSEPDLAVIAEADNGTEALSQVDELKPELLLLDWMLPQLNGLEVTRRIQEMDVPTKVLVLSMHAEESYVVQAFRNGALGYVLKDASGSELIEAIHTCHSGRRYLSEPFSEDRLLEFEKKLDTGKLDPFETLTDREREILLMVAEGQTSQQIADQLTIGRRTVETHRANLMRKLDLDSTYEVTKFAFKRGLISTNP